MVNHGSWLEYLLVLIGVQAGDAKDLEIIKHAIGACCRAIRRRVVGRQGRLLRWLRVLLVIEIFGIILASFGFRFSWFDVLVLYRLLGGGLLLRHVLIMVLDLRVHFAKDLKVEEDDDNSLNQKESLL